MTSAEMTGNACNSRRKDSQNALDQVIKANAAWVPPYGSGATLYIRPYMFASGPVIGVKPSHEYQFRMFVTPVGPYFKGGAKPITICVSDLTVQHLTEQAM